MHLPNPLSQLLGPAAEAALVQQPRTITVRLATEAVKQEQWPCGVQGHSDKHALGPNHGAQCAFKILMIHEVLQFALRIAFCCVLYRCGIQDIHCSKLY